MEWEWALLVVEDVSLVEMEGELAWLVVQVVPLVEMEEDGNLHELLRDSSLPSCYTCCIFHRSLVCHCGIYGSGMSYSQL